MNKTLFVDIFRDAHVVDLDFSTWDRAVQMVIVAIEATAFPKQRLPVYVVEFQRVHSMTMSFFHYAARLDFGHFQWNIDEAKIESAEELIHVHLSGSKHLPVTELDCEDIEIRALENDGLDRRFPGWSKPGSPFVRPGIEELLNENVRRK